MKIILINIILTIALSSTIQAQYTRPLKAVPEAGKVVALTFDDGIEKDIHKRMLKILKKENVPVTFFLLGKKLSDKSLLKKTIKQGHEIGNHSMTHPTLPNLTIDKIRKEVLGFQNILKKDFGYTPKVFRAPKLQYSEQVFKVLNEAELIPVTATAGTKDYAKETTRDYIINAATQSSKLGDGSIILMHEVNKTLDVLPEIIEHYKKEGYRFVTISQLINNTK